MLVGWLVAVETGLSPEVPRFLGTCFPEGTQPRGRSEQTNREQGSALGQGATQRNLRTESSGKEITQLPWSLV